MDDLFGEERATFDLSHCLDELGPLVFGEAFVATVAGPKTDVPNVPLGVVLRRRCPASDDVLDAVQFVLRGIGAKQNESGTQAPFKAFKLHELGVVLLGCFALSIEYLQPFECSKGCSFLVLES